MIGTVTFYRMRGSLSSGEYPLFSSGQDLSTYQVASFPRVKYRDGMQVSVELPYFQGLESANIAEIGGAFYWVTEYRQRTAESNQYTITLDYMGPTSLYRSGDSIKGSWHKLPTKVCPYLKNAVTNDIMKILSSSYPSDIDCPTFLANFPCFWIQITGYDGNGILQRYGCFVSYSTIRDVFNKGPVGMDSSHRYPSLSNIMTNITGCCSLLAENIVDISISRRCPYEYATVEATDGRTVYVRLLDAAGTVAIPTITGSLGYYLYDLENLLWHKITASVVISLSDFQRAVGQLCVRDWNNNNIMEIPTMYSDSLTVTFEVVPDIMGLYLKISCLDQMITIPEGHLPFRGSNWETYKAYQMDTDRMILENTLYNAREIRDTQMISGTVNGVVNGISTGIMTGLLGGNVAGAAVGIASGAASVGVGIWENQRAYELEEHNAEFRQNLSRRQAVSKPETSYNTGYGLIYGYQNIHYPLRVCLMMPSNVDANYYSAWVTEYGYPAEGVRTVTAVNGYYQGQLVDTVGGMEQDRTNEVFMRGFRFVDPSGAGPVPPTPGGSYTLTLRFDTSEATVPIVAQLMKDGTSVYTANITDSGVWAVEDLENGTYQIVTSANVTITPSLFTVNGSDVSYNVTVEDNTGALTVVKMGYYLGYGALADLGNLEWYGTLYDEDDNTILGYNDSITYTLGNGTTLTFNGEGGDLLDLCCAYEPVSASNPRTGLIGAEYHPIGDGYYAFYGGRCYHKASSSASYTYLAEIRGITCDKAQMLEIGTNTNLSMYLYNRGPTS